MVTVAVALLAAQAPLAAMVLVSVYVPGAEFAREITPDVAFRLKPAGVAVNVPAEAPLPSVGVIVPVAPAQKALPPAPPAG